ncbi:hypothetical protein [Erwinia sorbitola]|uniref:Lipoprotein n=1 Tax=Erwinia sorbitola TaxID=2681984 RepID=A0A6I6ER89_9GAMM|nr:hypothetical protein [Erwinia sorbitola]MTD25817.1 hypothetical protein [Erwinia sorbitola]QGU87629.1 hypothetical protein GN242_10535 [Erwinia sorbitola]
MKLTLLLVVPLILSGCALKQYPASPPVSAVQADQLDCQGVQQQIAEQARVQQQIDKTGEFDGLTVVGAALDFGIGNGIAKHQAQKHATERQIQLQQLAAAKCQKAS